MKIRMIQNSGPNDEGAFYQWEAEIDVADADEAYVKGREFARLSANLSKGIGDEVDARQESSE